MAYQLVAWGWIILLVISIAFWVIAFSHSGEHHFLKELSFITFIWAFTFLMSYAFKRSTTYIAVVERHRIDFLKEDQSGQVVYGCNNEQFFEKRSNCEIVIIDAGDSTSNTSTGLGDFSVPYVERRKKGTCYTVSLFGNKISSQPMIKDALCFYVSKSYLEDLGIDWSLLIEGMT